MARDTFTGTYLVLVLQCMVLLLPSLFSTGTLCAPQHHIAGRGCFASEREGLLLFKSQLKDPAGELLSWSGGDCCRWKGVGCDNRTGHVVTLDLHNNNNASDYFYSNYTWALSGEIHPSLHHLEHLQHLDLSGNEFGSPSIPKFIGSFMELKYLNLSGTSLVGTVPVQLGNLSNLQFLDLSYNFGLALSDAGLLAQLSSMEYVDMSGVNLGNSNNWLQALNVLPSISVIRLKQCRIESFPQSLPHVNFTSLTTLVLSQNYMFNSTFPDLLFRMSNLEHLDLSYTPSDSVVSNIGVIPVAIEHLHKLRFLDFSGDLLGGSIPASLGSLTLLQEINLSQNNLTGFIPKSLERLSSLKTLDLSSNRLRGTIPGSLGRLTSMQKLDLSSNNLSGPIPTSIGRLRLLQQLNLHSNAFSGSVPTSLGLLRSVQELDVSRNALGGSIPESLCGLQLLKKLDLSRNVKMNGTIPECIWLLAQMEILGLGGKGLEGVIVDSHFSNLTRLDSLTVTSSKSLVLDISSDWIPPFSLSLLYLLTCQVGPKFPKWIQTQDKLIGLSLRNVGIKESLPLWIWNFSSTLTVIDFYANDLSGKLPDATRSPSLSNINLSFNRLEGFAWLSDIWKMMPNLQYLSLAWNNVYGTIPASLCKLNLQRLDLSSNHFSGRIPGCLMKLHIYLNLGNNKLHGSFPAESDSLCSLTSLHLENNNLSGILPSSLRSCSDIVTLDLGQNKFTGILPTWLAESMSSLKILRLRSNMFSGVIPPSLSTLTSLQILDLSYNNLSGRIPRTFGNFTAMMSKHLMTESLGDYDPENISIAMKGKDMSFSALLPLVMSIDLSNNGLFGDIPLELGHLYGLVNLNLSANRLTGSIPGTISRLQALETLDLSRNHLTGGIPQIMSMMTSLDHLNLSFNNLSGKIPTANQFQTLIDPSIFTGNPNLCGSPLRSCDSGNSQMVKRVHVREHKDDREMLWLSLSTVLGFILGFWAFYGTLFFKKTWRNSYFLYLENMTDMLCLQYYQLKRKTTNMFK